MGKLALAFILASSLVRGFELPPGWDLVLESTQFERSEETFSLFSVKPTNIENLVASTPVEERRALWRKLYRGRRDAEELLSLIADFVYQVSVDRQLVTPDKQEQLRHHLQKIRSGRFPFMAVTKYQRPHRIYQVFGMGFDEDGIPLEQRLVGRGMSRLERPVIETSPVPICYVPRRGRPQCDPEISRILSLIPRRHGAIAEIRSITKDKERSPYDFTELLMMKATADQWLTESGIFLSDEEKPAPLTGQLLSQVQDLENRFPDIPKSLLYPELQERLVIDKLFAHTLLESRERVWRDKFGTSRILNPFEDPDFPGFRARILEISRPTLVEKTPLLLERLPDHHLVEKGRVGDNDLYPFACSLLLGNDYYLASKTLRPQSIDFTMILTSEEFLTPPHNCWIYRRMREMFPLPNP